MKRRYFAAVFVLYFAAVLGAQEEPPGGSALPQGEFCLDSDTIPSLESISKQVGNPVTAITWMSLNGNRRFKRAVLNLPTHTDEASKL